ncbi:MAG: hypothetical protein COA97_05470 [Flavobacteriales bacterium]|nr:MAG: hypothetical protein COA97_05470 [Flavobacteriales bacterium]
MKKLLLIVILLLSITTNAQTTAIPDPNFEQALISLGLDSGPIDGVVFTANINGITSLNVTNKNISDLTGIEDFTNLQILLAAWNQLTSLNVTQNTNLTYLYIRINQITSLNVTQNTALDFLNCGNNQLTNLDVSQNTVLTELWCYENFLTSLDVSQNTVLNYLHCDTNQLTCLNVKNGNNSNFTYFSSTYNPNLTCIEVDNISYSTTNWTAIDAGASFNTNCGNPCTVGIAEEVLTNLSLYPNPTTKTINIDLGEIQTNLTATLTNSLGQVILKQQYKSTNFISLDIDAKNGMYFLQLQTKGGEVITKKIVKE